MSCLSFAILIGIVQSRHLSYIRSICQQLTAIGVGGHIVHVADEWHLFPG